MARARAQAAHDAALRRLRTFGLGYPGTHTKSPWPGHLDLAVADKTFAYLSLEGEPLSISCKLPHSHAVALHLPGAKPTAYGLGKAGWVSLAFAPGEAIPIDMLESWIDESYRAQAPKRLVRELDARPKGSAPATTEARAARKKPRATPKRRSRPG